MWVILQIMSPDVWQVSSRCYLLLWNTWRSVPTVLRSVYWRTNEALTFDLCRPVRTWNTSTHDQVVDKITGTPVTLNRDVSAETVFIFWQSDLQEGRWVQFRPDQYSWSADRAAGNMKPVDLHLSVTLQTHTGNGNKSQSESGCLSWVNK